MEKQFIIYSELLITVLDAHFNSNYGVASEIKTTGAQPVVFANENSTLQLNCYAVIEEDGNVGLYW